MPAKRLLAHYKIDTKRNRLLMVACNAEDMLLPRSNFTFYGHVTCSNRVNHRFKRSSRHLLDH